MNSHVTDELPRLLTGDATRDEVLTAAAHLRACPDCQQELVSAVVAHASLTSAHRFAPEIVAHDVQDSAARDKQAPAELPDLTPVFAHAREEATGVTAAPARRHRLLAAAAAAVVIGGGATTAVLVKQSGDQGTRTVGLARVITRSNGAIIADDPSGKGTAKIVIDGNELHINASALPRLASNRVYELWLTDSARENMQPVGQLKSDNTAVLPVTPKVMQQYNDFEVSVQPTDQLKKYSGKSVLRGQYG
jgi:Anti-sigma-K factor rskA